MFKLAPNSNLFFEMNLPSLLCLLFYIVLGFLHILVESQNFELERIHGSYAAHMFPFRPLCKDCNAIALERYQ